MLKSTNVIIASIILISCLALTGQAAADETPTVIINNNAAPAPAANNNNNNQNNQNNCMNSDNDGMRGGTYYQTNPNGGTDTIYTTGDKQPYNVDNSCNNNNNNNVGTPIVQPLIYGPLRR